MSDGELGKPYGEGEIIFKEGDKGETMYVIQSGKVTIYKSTPAGDVHISELGGGEIFGEMALFDRLPRSASAKTHNEARILSIDKKKLFSTISKDPTLVFKILESMSSRIRRVNDELMKLKKYRSGIKGMSTDLGMISEMILEEAKNVISADNGSVMLLDDNGVLSIKAAFGSKSGKNMKLSVGEGIAGDVMKSGRSELVNNVSLDARFVQGGPVINCLLCVPLKSHDNPLGVINMSNTSATVFSLEDLKLLRAIAFYAAVALQNALNFSRLQTATDNFLMHASLLDI